MLLDGSGATNHDRLIQVVTHIVVLGEEINRRDARILKMFEQK